VFLVVCAQMLSKEDVSKQTDNDGRPSWMRQLAASVRYWKSLIPTKLSPLDRTNENIKDPFFRFFEREVSLGVRILRTVKSDLDEVMEVCEGRMKQTNHHRELLYMLNRGLLPKSWNQYKVPDGRTVIQWVTDFSRRIEQLRDISSACSNSKSLKGLPVWLGGLFVPEAYITATRQFVAHSSSRSLEELVLRVRVSDDDADEQTTTASAAVDSSTFALTGLMMQGSSCSNNRLSLSPVISTKLPTTYLSWIPTNDVNADPNEVMLPVYRNETRSDLLFTLSFAVNGDETSFYERGVAVLSAAD